MSSPFDFSDRIAASREEMLATYRRAHQTAVDPTPTVTPSAPVPPPIPAKPPVTVPVPDPVPRPEDTSYGYLQIRTAAASRSIPVPGALVVVTRPGDAGEELVALGETDQSGLSAVWTLPAPDPSQFERPETVVSPALYVIRTFADGYTEIQNLQVPLYGGIKVVQDVNMLPLPEAELFAELTFTGGPPADL